MKKTIKTSWQELLCLQATVKFTLIDLKVRKFAGEPIHDFELELIELTKQLDISMSFRCRLKRSHLGVHMCTYPQFRPREHVYAI